jgi:carboxymethylenebutenolidase
VAASNSGTMIQFAANGGDAPGYLARPEGDGPFPGIVVIQEWWGLDDHIKDVAERFAAEGYVALAPDLYRGEIAAEPDDARRLAMELELDQALVDIQGAVNYLLAQPDVEPKQAGVIGFCMGGRLTMMMSYRGENVGAAIVFYGGGVQPSDEELQAISAPLLGIYGEADEGIPVDRIQEWDTKLDEFGKVHEIHIYPDAPHAFFNDERPSYRATASADAWARTLEWLTTHLSS